MGESIETQVHCIANPSNGYCTFWELLHAPMGIARPTGYAMRAKRANRDKTNDIKRAKCWVLDTQKQFWHKYKYKEKYKYK